MLFEISLEKQPSLVSELALDLAVDYNARKYQEEYNNEEKQLYPYRYINQNITGEQINQIKKNFSQTREKIMFDSLLLQ